MVILAFLESAEMTKESIWREATTLPGATTRITTVQHFSNNPSDVGKKGKHIPGRALQQNNETKKVVSHFFGDCGNDDGGGKNGGKSDQ